MYRLEYITIETMDVYREDLAPILMFNTIK